MTFSITGADPDARTPVGCVARFLLAGAAQDNAGATAEVHPDSRAGLAGTVESPPGVIGATILAPEDHGDQVQVPTQLAGQDGTEQRFIFVVKAVGEEWGIHLQESLAATKRFRESDVAQRVAHRESAAAPHRECRRGDREQHAFCDLDNDHPRRHRVASEVEVEQLRFERAVPPAG